MSDEEFDNYLEGAISRVHQFLASNFTLVSGTRELNVNENALLLQLDQKSPKYKELAGALAIESYIEYVVQLLSGC